MTAIVKRDYSLTGEESERAVERGLSQAQWYRTDVSRKRMKELMQRRDGPAIRATLLWFALLILFGGLGVYLWFSVWSLLCFAVYGVLYGSASDARWHECGHGTAFKTRWMNSVVYEIACFMIMRDPTVWRWSHARHHTDTIIVGRDPEIVAKRPPPLWHIAGNFIGMFDVPLAFRHMSAPVLGRCCRPRSTAGTRDADGYPTTCPGKREEKSGHPTIRPSPEWVRSPAWEGSPSRRGCSVGVRA